MNRKRFSEEHFIKTLKAQEAGLPLAEQAREQGFAEGTTYRWKAKYGGVEVAGAKRLKELKAENQKLKNLLAATILEKVAPKDALGRKWQSLPPGGASFSTGAIRKCQANERAAG